MKIGYSADDATQRALIVGLQRRWCPSAELVPSHFRGSSKLTRRQEVPKICAELSLKGVDVIVFVTDCDARPWRDVRGEEARRIPGDCSQPVVIGVADRNVECWICEDRDYVARECGVPIILFDVEDPKDAFEEAMGISNWDRKEGQISALVERGPLRSWLSNVSFEGFYEDVRDVSQRHGCQIENLRERTLGKQ